MNFRRLAPTALVLAVSTLPAGAEEPAAPLEPREGIRYAEEFFPEARYDGSIPTPESILGFPVGERTASPELIERCLRAWEEASPRTRLVEYARSHEDRPLYYMIVSSPVNLSRLEEIRAGYARLADPRALSPGDGARLVESLPAVAWLAYSIHGNETSGSDAALAVLYHLTAATDAATNGLLDEVVVLVDPMMNPDGRARFLKQLDEHRAASPNLDDQSLLRIGYWPGGRTNHYLFDLNRDWILGVQPETRGRIRAAGEWHPLLFVDAHEMGAQDTYLFSPPRDPVNPNFPERQAHWHEVFARDQAAAFDRFPWHYYSGEWNEGWYPGYSDAWAGFRGAIGILYEQARVAEDAVRRAGGGLLPYRETVHHQVASTMANLNTLRRNARALLADFLAGRRAAVDAKGPFAGRTFAILPTENRSRLRTFAELMALQGIEVYAAAAEFTAPEAVDHLGRLATKRRLPEGTLLVPNRQPEGHLAGAMLEFDPRIPARSLERERREILRKGETRVYDVTAWNLTMLHGLEALTLNAGLPPGAAPYATAPEPVEPPPAPNPAAIAFVIDGADDLSLAAAARLLERGLEVRVADEAFLFDLHAYTRGSVLVTRADNPGDADALRAAVREAAGSLGLEFREVEHGFGEGDLPEIGGEHFRRLEPPRIAVAARDRIQPSDFGAIWHLLDHRLRLPHSQIAETALASTDLRRYNVLILPNRMEKGIDSAALTAVRAWAEAGGTLIAVGGSAAAVAAEAAQISRVRELPDVLDRLETYRAALWREILAGGGGMPAAEEIWSHAPRPGYRPPWTDAAEPAAGEKAGPGDVEEARRQDEWQKLFMPQGAILAGRVDREHWLTFGSGPFVPIVFGDHPVLMSAAPVETPVRLGFLEEEDAGGKSGRIGWATLPPGLHLRLRMSGLLWPEAAHRIANAAWVTREPLGRGQVILFASPPVFRGATAGTARILMNAILYGPGFGASHPIFP